MLSRDDSGPGAPVVRRLHALRPLSEAGAAAVAMALRGRILKAAAGEDIGSEGDRCDSARIFLSGWACRYKTLEDGRRQILSLVLPGDICDAHIYLLPTMDHSLAALTPATYVELDAMAFERLLLSDKSLAEAFHCETLVAGAIQREWAINLGRRVALERVAHLFCEIVERLRPVGMVDGNSCLMPVTQMDLADATGLSVVHLNRTLQELRAAGLIVLRERTLTIPDLDALKNAALYSPSYLGIYRATEAVR